jgi:tetratricopeptide (TPR) repeat protein
VRVQALAFAALLVASTHAQDDAARGETAERLIEAGRDELQRLDYAAAKRSFQSAIDSIERTSGPVSADLIEPLIALGDALVAMQQPAAAAETLRRAIALVRRSEGLHAERQYALLLKLVDLDSAAGRLDNARSGLKQMLRVNDQSPGKDWRERTRSQMEIGAWQCRIGDFDAGRRTHRQAVTALESRQDDSLRVDALLGLARCCMEELSSEGIETTPGTLERYRGRVQRTERMNPQNPAFRTHVNRVLRWEGERAVRRAAAIATEGRLDPEHSLRVFLQAGDWFQTKDHYRAARKYYAQAEQVAAHARGDAPLSAPVQLLYPVPTFALRARETAASEGTERYIEIEFQVQADGSVEAERVVDRDLGKSFVDEVLSAVRVARYRPRFEDGRATATEGVRRRQPVP